MRICSLVPAATEVLFALGLGDAVVGVTHECDFPAAAASRPAVTASVLDGPRLSSADVDRAVAEAVRSGTPLYAVDGERFSSLRADVVVAQEVCEVCAVSGDAVRALDVEVVDYSPTTLDGICSAIGALGRTLGAGARGEQLAASVRRRVAAVREAVAAGVPRPRVFVAEWLDPPYAAGHWVPEMVAAAGGEEVAGRARAPSFRTSWEAVALLEPELVVLAPCGFDLPRTVAEARQLGLRPPAPAVVAVDAGAHFSRPGPRIADGVEVLAHLLHPDAVPAPDAPFRTL